MSIQLTVRGAKDLDDKAKALMREAARFQRRVSQATGRAVQRVYKPVLIGMAPMFVPSGYANDLVNDLRVVTSVRFTGIAPGVTARVSAPTGGPRGRAVEQLEAGRLSHPLFGNKRHWYRQKIVRGFASVPLKAVQPQIVREIDGELATIRRDVEGA